MRSHLRIIVSVIFLSCAVVVVVCLPRLMEGMGRLQFSHLLFVGDNAMCCMSVSAVL